MKFRYLRDPLFLLSLSIYLVNRLWLEPMMPDTFFNQHLNDLLCIPLCVPVMLYLLRRVGLRTQDHAPGTLEIIVPLIVWSSVFEIWLPDIGPFRGAAVRDHADIFWYALGALVALLSWQRKPRTTPSIQESSPPAGHEAHRLPE